MTDTAAKTPTPPTDRATAGAAAGAGSPQGKPAFRLIEGFDLQPLHDEGSTPTAAEPAGLPGVAPFTRGRRADGNSRQGWDLRAQVRHPDPTRAIVEIADAVALGARSLRLVLDPAAEAGIALGEIGLLAPVFDAIPLRVGVDVLAPWAGVQAARDQLAALRPRGGCLGLDPIGSRLRHGGQGPIGPELVAAAGLIGEVAQAAVDLRALRIDTLPISEAGGSAVEELSWALACGVAWLRAGEAQGLSVAATSRQLQLDLAIGGEVFLELAKIRAARTLWARLTEACGQASPLLIHAIQARRGLSRPDPHVNLLRGTASAYASVLGGADAVTVLPFDDRCGLAGARSRRLALTTQLVLQDESQLHRLVDPAGGSWSVEQMTADLCAQAWAAFQALEARGGVQALLEGGALLAWLDPRHATRTQALRRRSLPLTGVSEFPDPEGEPFRAEQVDSAGLRARLGLKAPPAVASAPGLPLPFRPLAAPWERLVDAAAAHSQRGAGPPQVCLLGLGPLAEHSARSSWTTNLLQAGGFDVRAAEDLPDAESALAAADRPVVVLSTSDARLVEGGPALIAALHAAGHRVAVAGRPGPAGSPTAPEAWGAPAPTFLFAGSDVCGSLEVLLRQAGVEILP